MLGDLTCESERRDERRTRSRYPIDQTDPVRFIPVHIAAGEDQIECSTLTDQSGKPDRTAVGEGQAPPATGDAQPSVGRGDSEIAPDRQFQSARNCEPLDRSDHGLREKQACGAKRRSTGRFEPIGIPFRRCFEVSTGAERVASAGENSDKRRVVLLERDKGTFQGLGCRAIDCVASVRPVNRDDPNRCIVRHYDWFSWHAAQLARSVVRPLANAGC